MPSGLCSHPLQPLPQSCAVWLWNVVIPNSQSLSPSWRTTLEFPQPSLSAHVESTKRPEIIFPPHRVGGTTLRGQQCWVGSALFAVLLCGLELKLLSGGDFTETWTLVQTPSILYPTSLTVLSWEYYPINPFHINPSFRVHTWGTQPKAELIRCPQQIWGMDMRTKQAVADTGHHLTNNHLHTLPPALPREPAMCSGRRPKTIDIRENCPFP